MDFTAEYQRLLHENYLQQIEERPYLAGSAIWSLFDFGEEDRGGCMPHINNKGMLTYDRQPKDVYFFYKAKFSSQPVLRIATREWQNRTGTNTDAPRGSGLQVVRQPVQVYSNAAQVELFVNGESLGAKQIGADRQAWWEVPFRDGINTISARGSRGGESLYDRVEVRFTYRARNLADPSVPFRELAGLLECPVYRL